MKHSYFGILALLFMAAGAFAAGAPKADTSDSVKTEAASAPDFGSSWGSNGAYSLAGLKGKVVVLYYFDVG